MAKEYRLISSHGHLEMPPERWTGRVPPVDAALALGGCYTRGMLPNDLMNANGE
jgi:hypothetical protein